MTEHDDRFKQLAKLLKQSDDQLRQLRQHLEWLPESEQLELLKRWPRSEQLGLLKRWSRSKQLELLKRVSRPAPAPSKLPIRHRIIQSIMRKLYPPNGKVSLEVRTAKLKRQIDAEWEAACKSEEWQAAVKQHGVSSKKPPDRHVIARAIDRKV